MMIQNQQELAMKDLGPIVKSFLDKNFESLSAPVREALEKAGPADDSKAVEGLLRLLRVADNWALVSHGFEEALKNPLHPEHNTVTEGAVEGLKETAKTNAAQFMEQCEGLYGMSSLQLSSLMSEHMSNLLDRWNSRH